MPGSIEPNRLEQLLQIAAPQSILVRTWPLKGGISADMTALEIKHPDGHASRMIPCRPGERTISRNPNAAAAEFKILQMTRSMGLPTPRPHYLDLSGTIFPTRTWSLNV